MDEIYTEHVHIMPATHTITAPMVVNHEPLNQPARSFPPFFVFGWNTLEERDSSTYAYKDLHCTITVVHSLLYRDCLDRQSGAILSTMRADGVHPF